MGGELVWAPEATTTRPRQVAPRKGAAQGVGPVGLELLTLQRQVGNREVVRRLLVQRDDVTIEEVTEPEKRVVKNPDAEELDLTHPYRSDRPYPTTGPKGHGEAMSYPVNLPVLGEEQRRRNQDRLRARQAEDRAKMGSRPAVLYDGAAAGPALDEGQAADAWNKADLPALEAAVGQATTNHGTWAAALATAQAQMPRLSAMLFGPTVRRALDGLEATCSNFTGLAAAQRGAATADGFHGVRAAHEQVKAALADPALTGVFGKDGTMPTVGSAFLALPAPVLTAVERQSDPVLRILSRLSEAEVALIGAVPVHVIELWTVRGPGEIMACITNSAALAGEVTRCTNAFTRLTDSTPGTTHFPEAMARGTKKDVWDRVKAKIAPARTAAMEAKKKLLAETGGADGGGAPLCTKLWFMKPADAGAAATKVEASATEHGRFKTNLQALAASLQAKPPGHDDHNYYWYLAEHLAKPGGKTQDTKLDQLLDALAVNAPGWVPGPDTTKLLDAAVYGYQGLGQGSIKADGTGSKNRGAGVLAAVRYDPKKVAEGGNAWMSHVRDLRALVVGTRHSHATVRPDLHTTDPAKLGEAGSETAIKPDKKPGARTLTGGDKGYEYSIPGFSGARLIEVPRTDRVDWTDASWYLSMGHYESYDLITNLP